MRSADPYSLGMPNVDKQPKEHGSNRAISNRNKPQQSDDHMHISWDVLCLTITLSGSGPIYCTHILSSRGMPGIRNHHDHHYHQTAFVITDTNQSQHYHLDKSSGLR